MHKCAAKCCENPSASMEEVHLCIENCSKPISEAQTFLQKELTNYQVSNYIYITVFEIM